MSTLVQKLVLGATALVSVIVGWLGGKLAASRKARKDLELEQRADQVQVLRTDVEIDQRANEAKQEVENRPMPKPPLSREEAVRTLERLRKKFP